MTLTPAIAKYIVDKYVGCRDGTTIQGAAYAFLDIVGEGKDGGPVTPPFHTILDFIRDPNQAQFEPRWDDRLWNMCGKILDLEPSGTLLLVSQALPAEERYLFNGGSLAKGDGYTFRKNSRLPPDAQILASMTYNTSERVAPGSGERVSAPTIQALTALIFDALRNLADVSR